MCLVAYPSCDTICVMVRTIGYRAAVTAFVFTALWLVFGLLLFSTPIPHALGIGAEFFTVWLLLFFVILAASGAMLVIAAFNGIFVPDVRAPRRAGSLWAAGDPRSPGGSAPAGSGVSSRRPGG